MKTLYIFRDSYDAQYILSVLDKKGVVDAVILESGKYAKNKKLKRFFKDKSFFSYPAVLFNILSLVIYSFIMTKKMKTILGHYRYPDKKDFLQIDDVNEEKCISFVKKIKPDIIFIYGTGIVKKDFLNLVTVPILNIHTGILPKYRNVHSDFWAYKNKDYKNIGTTIIYLDAGVDTGDIALMQSLSVSNKTTLLEIKVNNLKQIPDMIDTVLEQMKKGKNIRQKQQNKDAHDYMSPGFLDFFSLIRR